MPVARPPAHLLLIALAVSSFLAYSCSDNESNESSLIVERGRQAAVNQQRERPGNLIAYLVSDTRIPFWEIMARGIASGAADRGYELAVYSSENSAKSEIESTVRAINSGVQGIIVSPTNSSACVTILELAKKSGVPVVISDIGTNGGEYVCYISSDNQDGAYQIGRVLAEKMTELGWNDGRVGIIAIPQRRANGQARTAGFMKAMNEAGIKGADIKQQKTWTEEETYNYSMEMIKKFPDLRAIWLQGSDRYNGALRAMADAGRTDEMLLLTFDAEPNFIELIQKGVILGSAMQQPYLMGQAAMEALDNHLKGREVPKNIALPILAISEKNLNENIPIINERVLGKPPGS